MTHVLAILTATVVGLMVGVETTVAFVVNPIVVRLPVAPSIEARADGARMLGRAMPFWYFGSLALTVLLAAATWATPAAAVPAVIGAILLAVSVVLSVTLLVPINNRSATWTAENHPADWRDQLTSWDRFHYLRLAVIVTAFVFVLVAATSI